MIIVLYRRRAVDTAPCNHLLAARMRDSKRWVKRYREVAFERALVEARRRTFLSSIFFVVSQWASLTLPQRKRLE